MKIVLVFLTYGALVGWIFHLTRQVVYWRDKAMAEARKRLAKDEKTTEIRRAIDRGAAKLISEKDAQIRALRLEIERKQMIMYRLWEHLRDLKAGGDFDD